MFFLHYLSKYCIMYSIIANNRVLLDIVKIEYTLKKGDNVGAVYESTTTNVNMATGEIITKEKTVINKNKKEEYVRFYLNSVAGILNAKLRAIEHDTLYILQRLTINNSNLLFYNTAMRKEIAQKLNVTPETVRKAVSKLVTTGIINRTGQTYYLNPIHFGRGDWKVIKSLRKNVETVFDFEKLTVEQKETATALYENPETIMKELINADDVEVIESSRENEKTREISYTNNNNDANIIDVEPTKELKTLDDLFAIKTFSSLDDDINNATQNSDIRDLAYKNLEEK